MGTEVDKISGTLSLHGHSFGNLQPFLKCTEKMH